MERIEILSKLKFAFSNIDRINSFMLHGSLTTNNFDLFSDIDIQIDVSGYDNGQFMLDLPSEISKYLDIGYIAYAPRFVPDLYLITIYFQDTNLFHFVDIECIATPHITSISKDKVLALPETKNTKFKLLLNCLKSHLRGKPDNAFLEKCFNGTGCNRNEYSIIEKMKYCFYEFEDDINDSINTCALNAINLINLRLTTAST